MSDVPATKPKPGDDESSEHPPHAWLPEAHFGTAITPLPELIADAETGDDDDSEEIPPDVSFMLGFDPTDEADDAEGDEDADD